MASEAADKAEETQRQLRADFYEREKSAARRARNYLLYGLGEKVGAHKAEEDEIAATEEEAE